MDANDSNPEDKYIPLLLFTLIFVVLFIIYLSLIIMYIIKNYQDKKICKFWFDYCILIFGGIFYTLVYLIYLIFSYKKGDDRTNQWFLPKLKNFFYPPAVVISLSFMCFTLIATLLFDAITAIRLSIKMNKMKAINDMDLNALSDKLNNIDYVDILKMKSHYIYNFVFLIINLILIGLEIIAYIDLNPDTFGEPWNLLGFFNYLLHPYHVIVLVFLIISICIMNYNKNLLLRRNYYNPNRIAQKVYDTHFDQIFYFTDVLSFKLVADLIMDIPTIFFMTYGKFDAFTLIFSEIAIFSYIFLGGCEYLVIDKHSKVGKVNKWIKKFFCLRLVDFHFGEKDVRYIKDEVANIYSKGKGDRSFLENELLKDENENSLSNSNIELQTTK